MTTQTNTLTLRAAAGADGADAAARVDVVPALTLADFDANGLELDMLALIRAGAGPNYVLYAVPPRGSVGELLDGELGLGETEAAITCIRRRTGTMLVVSDNDPLSLAAFFGGGGAGADLTLYVQTLAGVASTAVSAHARAGDNMIRFGAADSDFQALLDGIDDGDRFIFALARPARAMVAVRGAAKAAARETTARARLRPIGVRAIRGQARSGSPIGLTRVLALDPAHLYQRAIREAAPADRVVTALEIRHPAVAQPVRVVNDTVNHRIEGSEYIALRFDARLVDDIAGQAPQAELSIDNIGRDLTQWIEAAGGGIGATVRVMLVLAVPNPPVEWELTLDVAGITVDQERVTARLGFDPLLGAAAVRVRHDPQTSPGLF